MLREKMVNKTKRVIETLNGRNKGDIRAIVYPLVLNLADEYSYDHERNLKITDIAADIVADAISRYEPGVDGNRLNYVCWFMEAAVTLVMERMSTKHPQQIRSVEDFYMELGLMLAGVTYTYEVAEKLGVEDSDECFTKIFKVLMRQRIA